MPALGELWRGRFQIGLEATPGTAVPATRIMYFRPDSSLSREREARRHHMATTTRDNVRAVTHGPVTAGGTVSLPVSAQEMLEMLRISMNGATVPTGTGPYLWTFKPGTDLETITIEWHDGARAWVGTGMRGNTLRIAGNVRQENIATIELFGQDVNVLGGGITPALTERLPQFFEGWQTRLYIGALGGTVPATPATTTNQILGTLLNWDVTFNNNLTRKYFAEHTLQAGAVPSGELEVTCTFTFEGNSATTAAEFTNWNTDVNRLVTLMFSDNTDTDWLAIDLPGSWSTVDLTGNEEGTRTYQFTYGYVYDTTNGYGVQVRSSNPRAAASIYT